MAPHPSFLAAQSIISHALLARDAILAWDAIHTICNNLCKAIAIYNNHCKAIAINKNQCKVIAIYNHLCKAITLPKEIISKLTQDLLSLVQLLAQTSTNCLFLIPKVLYCTIHSNSFSGAESEAKA